MSELEKKNVNEMDAAEMLERCRNENASAPDETSEAWAERMTREFDVDVKKRRRLQSWGTIGLCVISGLCGLAATACCAGVTFGNENLILVGIGAANLMMAGAWWQKAKAGWQV